MTPVFAPERQLNRLIKDHSVSEEVFRLTQQLRREYSVENPLDIGILSLEKRFHAALVMIQDVEGIRKSNALSGVEAALILLNVVCKVSRCKKAMKGFHYEWHRRDGAVQVPEWFAHVGY